MNLYLKRVTIRSLLLLPAYTLLVGLPVFAQGTAPSVRVLLPERTRLLQGQLVDLVLEVRNATAVTDLKVTAGSVDLTAKFGLPAVAALDCDTTPDMVVRADLQSFNVSGDIELNVSLSAGGTTVTDKRIITVREFNAATLQRRNIILFIGDGMGTAYRDAARLVSRSIVDDKGKNSFRDGFFDDLLEMDKMPVSGMSMTYGTDSIVPDSANTGTAWSTGNKSFLNAINVVGDGNDCRWRFTGLQNVTTLPAILDNPRVESLFQYLKRRFQYRTGIVSTAAITDATPAVQGSYVGIRSARLDIARQYVENPMLGGRPAFDVIFGGGTDPFTAAGRPDQRNLIGELQAQGYRYVTTAAGLRGLSYGQPAIGLFKGSVSPAPNTNGITTAADVNMDVAYDKLGLARPASEPAPSLGAFADQPMLDLMTQKAIEILSTSFSGTPFVLMVEGASIDKQSHSNHAAGTIWDTIEFDKSIGVARSWAAKRFTKDTLIVVTADHDQSMSIIGVSNSQDSEYFDRTKNENVRFKTASGDQNFIVFGDSATNAHAGLPFINSSAGASNNGGTAGMPMSFSAKSSATDPASNTYSTYFGSPAYSLEAKTGYPVNSGAATRRLAVGFRTGDHTGSSVPITAEGPGAFLFNGYMDQTDIFFKMAATLSNDTSDIDKMLELMMTGNKYPKSVGK